MAAFPADLVEPDLPCLSAPSPLDLVEPAPPDLVEPDLPSLS